MIDDPAVLGQIEEAKHKSGWTGYAADHTRSSTPSRAQVSRQEPTALDARLAPEAGRQRSSIRVNIFYFPAQIRHLHNISIRDQLRPRSSAPPVITPPLIDIRRKFRAIPENHNISFGFSERWFYVTTINGDPIGILEVRIHYTSLGVLI